MLERVLGWISRLRGGSDKEKSGRALYVTKVLTQDEDNGGYGAVFLAYDPVLKRSASSSRGVVTLLDSLESFGYNFINAPDVVNVNYGGAPDNVREMFKKMSKSAEVAKPLNRGEYATLTKVLGEKKILARKKQEEAVRLKKEAENPGESKPLKRNGAADFRREIQNLGRMPDNKDRRNKR